MKIRLEIIIIKTLTILLILMLAIFLGSNFLCSQTVNAEQDHDSDIFFEISKPIVGIFSLNKDGDINLTKNFKVCEFSCHDGTDKILIDLELVRALQYIRDYFDKPLHINSAYRTKAHNEEIGGCEESYNLLGQGVDFFVEDISNIEVASLAEHIGIKGIIVFIDKGKSLHIDSRETQWYAYYSHEEDKYEEIPKSSNGSYFN